MKKEQGQAKINRRKKRLARMLSVLKKLYPDPRIALNYSNDWELLVAVVLSAQCTDNKVNEVTKSLFKKYPNISAYTKAGLGEFENDIKPTGFYRNKAKNILSAAKFVVEKFNGKLPRTMEEMVAIPGVARKSANVILSNAYGIVEGIAVDTHVRRFAIRFDLSDSKDPKIIEKDLMMICPKKDWMNLTYRFIDYGREICPARKHDCAKHPLTKIYPPAVENWPKAK